jgi:hypothetical protein
MIDTEELIHVYKAHTANGTRIIDGEEGEYSREELLEIVKEARNNMALFLEKWLIPAISELDRKRALIAKINDMTDTF